MATRMAARVAPHVRGEGEERVTALELFFDLVFVFALTQVTAVISADPTWEGMARGLLILALAWWAWVGYAWLTSVVDPEEGFVRLAMFAAMAAFLIVSLAAPEAFDDHALIFALAYAVVRLAQLVLFLIAAGEDEGLRRAVRGGLIPSSLAGSALLVAASFLDGVPQGALWVVALSIDLLGPFLYDPSGWRLAPGHFAERHGLIVIIALGESIVAVGVGAEGIELDAGVITAAVLGVVVAATLWWAYFDVVALVAERRLRDAPPGEQQALARDGYSFLHFPMIAGIVLFAVGVKKTLGNVDDPLKTIPAVAMCGGLALYLLAHVAFRLRNVHTWAPRRPVVAALLLATIPAGLELPALATLAIVTALMTVLIAYEAIRYADARDRVRHALETAG